MLEFASLAVAARTELPKELMAPTSLAFDPHEERLVVFGLRSDERYAFYLLDARDLALVRCVDFQFYSSTVLQFYSSTVLQFYISTCLHCYISTLRFS